MVATALFALALAASVRAQSDGPVPSLNANPTNTSDPRLVGKLFTYADLPYQVDTSDGERGPQAGYNICNSTTEGQTSLCQTAIVNSLQDFCIWAPSSLNDIGDAEGEVVAWCTQSGHGARVIPAGTITGAQFIKTPSYIEVTGLIVQTNIDITSGDEGGELDSGGQDERGNPMGGVMFSNDLPYSTGNLTMSRMWHQFIGSNVFCLKLCDNNAADASGLCRHTLDTVGCNTAVPASYVDGQFTQCEGDDQAPVQSGVTSIPSSSNCVTYASTDLWSVVASATVSSTTTSGSSTATSSSTTKSSSTKTTTTTSSDSSSTSSASGFAPAPVKGAAGAYAFIAAVIALIGGAAMA